MSGGVHPSWADPDRSRDGCEHGIGWLDACRYCRTGIDRRTVWDVLEDAAAWLARLLEPIFAWQDRRDLKRYRDGR